MLFLEHLMRSSLFLASQGRYELVPGGIAALMHWHRLWPLGTQQGPFAKHTHLCITGPVGGYLTIVLVVGLLLLMGWYMGNAG
jgi:hypothetical protein